MWIPLLRLGGVRVYLDPLIAVVLVYLVFFTAPGRTLFAPAGILLGSVLLHELAHAWMARRRGLVVGGIFLHLVPFAYVERGKPEDELRVALAGPAVNLLLAAGFFAVPAVRETFPWTAPGLWFDDPLWTAFGINLVMGTLNLIPALPADGGRALRAGLMTRLAPGTAYARTARVGTFVGVGCFVLVAWTWPSDDAILAAILGVFFIMTAWREARAGIAERQRERQRARERKEAKEGP